MKRYYQILIAVGVIWVGMLGSAVIAQEEERVFPTDKQGFIKALGLGLRTKGLTGIVNDYDVENYDDLKQFPIAGVSIHFAVNSTYIPEGSRNVLKELAQALREFPKTALVIAGHTDDSGTDEYNLALSQSRSLAVWGFLVEDEQIPADRLSFTGFGEFHPFADNSTEEGRALNRRVEFIKIPASSSN